MKGSQFELEIVFDGDIPLIVLDQPITIEREYPFGNVQTTYFDFTDMMTRNKLNAYRDFLKEFERFFNADKEDKRSGR